MWATGDHSRENGSSGLGSGLGSDVLFWLQEQSQDSAVLTNTLTTVAAFLLSPHSPKCSKDTGCPVWWSKCISIWKVEAGGSEVRGQSQLHRTFENILGCIRRCFKNSNTTANIWVGGILYPQQSASPVKSHPLHSFTWISWCHEQKVLLPSTGFSYESRAGKKMGNKMKCLFGLQSLHISQSSQASQGP